MLPEHICMYFEPFCQGCGECDPVIRDERERFSDGYMNEFTVGEATFTCSHMDACKRMNEKGGKDNAD